MVENFTLFYFTLFYQFFKVVDSITALFRVDFSGRGELAERQVFSQFSLEVAHSIHSNMWLQFVAKIGANAFTSD